MALSFRSTFAPSHFSSGSLDALHLGAPVARLPRSVRLGRRAAAAFHARGVAARVRPRSAAAAVVAAGISSFAINSSSKAVTAKCTTNERLQHAEAAMQGYDENMQDAVRNVENFDDFTATSTFGVYDDDQGLAAVPKYDAKHIHIGLLGHQEFPKILPHAVARKFLRTGYLSEDGAMDNFLGRAQSCYCNPQTLKQKPSGVSDSIRFPVKVCLWGTFLPFHHRITKVPRATARGGEVENKDQDEEKFQKQAKPTWEPPNHLVLIILLVLGCGIKDQVIYIIKSKGLDCRRSIILLSSCLCVAKSAYDSLKEAKEVSELILFYLKIIKEGHKPREKS